MSRAKGREPRTPGRIRTNRTLYNNRTRDDQDGLKEEVDGDAAEAAAPDEDRTARTDRNRKA